jgi:hypothetical protein
MMQQQQHASNHCGLSVSHPTLSAATALAAIGFTSSFWLAATSCAGGGRSTTAKPPNSSMMLSNARSTYVTQAVCRKKRVNAKQVEQERHGKHQTAALVSINLKAMNGRSAFGRQVTKCNLTTGTSSRKRWP